MLRAAFGAAGGKGISKDWFCCATGSVLAISMNFTRRHQNAIFHVRFHSFFIARLGHHIFISFYV